MTTLLLALLCLPAADDASPLQTALQAETPSKLVESARTLGDARRGVAVFDLPGVQCARCHTIGGEAGLLGPDLARLGPDVTPERLAEAILSPSKTIRPGFETISISTQDGRAITGLLAEERPDAIVLRDPSQIGRTIVVPRGDVDERRDDGPSLMPTGLVDAIGSRSRFLDLLRFLIECQEGGPERASELRPAPATPPIVNVPEYENDLDHAGLIGDLDAAALERGRAIFERVCANCHGTADREGSLPTAPRFARPGVALRNGRDPYAMYRTLTYGFGQMPPQTWMMPRQKYDVIHYLRESYLKPTNLSQYARIDAAYRKALPVGTGKGPMPATIEPWEAMDYGSSLISTYEVGDDGSNFAYKGIAVRLDPGPGGVARGSSFALFDHDTMRLAAAWTGPGFIDWQAIHFDGRHGTHPRLVGQVRLAIPNGPGWANPADGSFEDVRLLGRDGRRYGPLPKSWAKYRGTYLTGDSPIISYSVGNTSILERETGEDQPAQLLARSFEIGPRDRPLTLQVAHLEGPEHAFREPARPGKAITWRSGAIVAGLSTVPDGASWEGTATNDLRLHLPAGNQPIRFTLRVARVEARVDREAMAQAVSRETPPIDLAALAKSGSSRWPTLVTTRIVRGESDGPYAMDVLELPDRNPWNALVRPTGLDFLPGGDQAMICTWDGDVWLVRGLDHPEGQLTWRRFASGLFQPLGIKVLDGRILVSCRDQIVSLRDLDGDGEADFLECFNDDHQVTDHFHEFAMGLQADAEGNLYYAKSARHGLKAVVPQHGTLLKVSRDGSTTEILATGFRAANGVCVNDDGTFFLTDQEGFWMPKNRINWVRPGKFYGNMWGYHDVQDTSDSAMEPPLCWITNKFDRSPAELLRVEGDRWGLPSGTLLNLSYGEGKIFTVPHEQVGDVMQGGMVALPIDPLPTGVMRGRFHPVDGQLYACGMYAWAGNRTQPGGFYRIRSTGQAACQPVGFHAREGGLDLTFSSPLDPASVTDPSRFSMLAWSLKRTANYGSEHHDERPWKVTGARLSDDGKTLALTVPDLAPTWCFALEYTAKRTDGPAIAGTLHGTIHRMAR